MNRILSVFFFLFLAISAQAYKGEYRLGLFKTEGFSYARETHIIVAGSALKEDSDQFFRSGLSRAQRIREVYPEDQIVIISSPEVINRNDDVVFSNFNIPVIKVVNESLTQERFISELVPFVKIKSINFFGHSSPWAFKLGKKDAAFDPESVETRLSKISGNFTKDSYIVIQSCNAGFMIAPALSRILKVPVAGNLTSGLFERIESDGQWYKESDRHSEQYVTENKFSFDTNISCAATGACVRMKPSSHNYSSYWGTFSEGGLSFPKFFCSFENQNSRCEKAMALSLLTFPSVRPLSLNSNKEDFKDVLYDWLCQTTENKDFRTQCIQGLNAAVARGDLIYKSHSGQELQCDFQSCHAKVICKKAFFGGGPRAGSCHLETTATSQPTNTAREYLSFIKGFEAL